MCGRTACTLDPEEVSRASRYRNRHGQRRQPRWRDGDADKYRPSYNKSPQSFSPVLLSQRHFDKDASVDECVVAAMRWGLIPSWFREDDPRKMQYSTNNCRSESLLDKKSYKDPFLKGQRCVILADGFYEWRRQGKEKQPFFIYFPQSQPDSGLGEEEQPDESDVEFPPEEKASNIEEESETDKWTGWRLLTIAGLFDCWKPPGGEEPIYTYTVITVDASPNLQNIHDRMPAVLDGEADVRRWLDFGEVKSSDALKLLQPTNILTFHPVSSLVNNSRNNSPECLQPVDPQAKKEPKPTASSKMMMSWLKDSSSSKRKEPSICDATTREQQPKAKEDLKSSGTLENWLKSASKKARID
ncbi:abasic site processing protein HMCES [Gadus morhua]|uniref:abasic site processing protein HMCES n=1 Tax=Gadus morhua TaxID=8049 RepID=UPI0011B683F6|nr:abasic site processing protein HMCES [Gadus morhua]XP_030229497.1 abasic site processing protein HMCES [Gadus morhua]